MTSEELQAIRELANAATSGPWKFDSDYQEMQGWGIRSSYDMADVVVNKEDGEFIAWCREGVPKLLDYINELENLPLNQTVKEQQKEIERLRGDISKWIGEEDEFQRRGGWDRFNALEEENQRLREGLNVIKKLPNEPSPYNPGTWDFEGKALANGFFEGLDKASDIAGRLLEGESHANL